MNQSTVVRQWIEKVFPFTSALISIVKVEKLDGKDQVYCGKCKTHQDHTKQVTLYRAPPVLIIHLKRFKFTQQYSEKIATEVRFPLVGLDLSFAYASKSAKPVALDMTWWEYLGGKYSFSKDSVPGHNSGNNVSTAAQATNSYLRQKFGAFSG